ncbi:MAG: PilT/PilU family type 4a pilus ATPase [Oscillospiraceae bacterium]|jgi:twitching motility protein PilT|nr:PilT/PilU family type 4a pilus ATPase [Oscillospiraceae bacterium]
MDQILSDAVELNASDVFIVAGSALTYKINGVFIPQEGAIIMPANAHELVERIYELAGRNTAEVISSGDDDFAFSIHDLSRFRANVYKQRGSLSAVIRIIPFGIPDYHELRIPENIIKTADVNSGLILVTGLAGSGKSTTLACMIDHINRTRAGHIVTLEDPIEYLHRNNKCIISQREISLDTDDYVSALRACLRQAPDVILVGEVRDRETIQTVLTAAETGHLVITTMHTIGAADTIDRIIDIFPSSQQRQVRVQLSMLLQAVISQQLIPDANNVLTPVFEIMYNNTAISTMIRESKEHQIDTAIASGGADGMVTMDAFILNLVNSGEITKDTALKYSSNNDLMTRRLAAIK